LFLHQGPTGRQTSGRALATRLFFGWWAVFFDPDGNRYALNQRDQ